MLLVFLAAAPFSAPRAEDTDARISRLENEIQTLSRAMFRGEKPPEGASFGGGAANNAAAEVRLQQLETQIRELTGRIEEQGNRIDRLTRDLENMAAAQSAPAPISNSTGFQNPPIVDNSIPDSAPPQPSPATSADPNYQWSSGGSAGGAASSGSLGSISGNAAAVDIIAQSYEAAFAQLKNGQYDAAGQSFSDFLKANPNHALSDNARYWLGESQYARGQYEPASRTFAQGFQKNPKGPKAPDNLLKLGMSLAGMGKKDDACVAMRQIEKEFSATVGPVLKRAQDEMARIGC